MPGFFHSTLCLWDSTLFLHIVDLSFYLLYNISEKRFVEQGLIRSVESNRPSTKYEALFAERKPLNIRYLPYSTPNCGIIPTSKKKVEEILNVAV